MTRISAEHVSDVVGHVYDAAYGVATWNSALDKIANLFHSPRAWLFISTPQELRGHTSVEDEGFHSPEAMQVMLTDPLYALTHSAPEGAIVRHSELEDLNAFYGRSLFQDWLVKRDVWFGMQTHVRADRKKRIFLDVSHHLTQGDFDDGSKQLAILLAPHIRRATEISDILGQAITSVTRLAAATIIVDDAMHIVEMNAAASAVLERADSPISQSGATLYAAFEPARLGAMVANAIYLQGGGQTSIFAHAANDRTGLVVSVAPYGGFDGFRSGRAPFAMLCMRPVHGSENCRLGETLVELFGLTRSEAKLTGALAAGCDLRQAAAERGITYATARTYLDRIYRKTGAGHQGALVALVKNIEATQVLES